MKTFVYIASPSYSGSTLLTFLLNVHPSVCTVGELKAGIADVNDYSCSCGKPILACDFWRRVADAYAGSGTRFDLTDFGTRFERQQSRLAGKILGAQLRGPLFELVRDFAVATIPSVKNAKDNTLHAIETFARIVTGLTGTDVFVDGSKDAFRLKYLCGMSGFNFRVIRIIRDGRGVMNSTMKHLNCSAEKAATLWRDETLDLERARSWFNENHFTTVHYEHLCTHTDEALARLFGFIGLSVSDVPKDYRSVEHHIMGNAMRLSNSSGIELDTRWKRELDAGQLAVFDRVAGAVNRRYGYES